MIDFSKIGQPKEEFPIFDREYPTPIKGLVIEPAPGDRGWELVTVTVYLEDNEWLLDKMAIMELKEVAEIADQKEWVLITAGFMQKIQGLEDGQTA